MEEKARQKQEASKKDKEREIEQEGKTRRMGQREENLREEKLDRSNRVGEREQETRQASSRVGEREKPQAGWERRQDNNKRQGADRRRWRD